MVGGLPLRHALLRSGFQGVYTTVRTTLVRSPRRCAGSCASMMVTTALASPWQVFGAFATLLLLRTGSLAAPVAAHVFCNWQGFPDFPRMLQHSRGARFALTSGVIAFVVSMRAFCASAAWGMTATTGGGGLAVAPL